MAYESGGISSPSNNAERSVANRLGFSQTQTEESGTIAYGMETNDNYIVRCLQEGKLVAKGFIPETFQLSVVSRYGQPFGQGIAQQGVAATAAKVLGHTTLTSQSMTMQVWEGSEPLELQFEFDFLAEKDPYKEVIEPIKKLLQLVMPGGDGTLLKPPGPQIQWLDSAADVAGAAFNSVANMAGAGVASQNQSEVSGALKRAVDGAKNKISIFVGNFLAFDNVVIESVNQTYHSMFDEMGQPLRATVAITFKTFMVPTSADLNTIFVHHGDSNSVGDFATLEAGIG